MKPRKKRTLTKAELRAMGASPGFMAHKIAPDGRARLEQLTSEAQAKPAPFFRQRLTRADEDAPRTPRERR